MEAAPAVPAGALNGGLPVPPMSSSSSHTSRKEWRVVSEQSMRNSGDEGLDRSKLVQSDERLIYEVHRGREPVDVDFCSITIDGCLDNDIMQQRLGALAKQREELQQVEIELRAQVIVRSEIVGMQNTFDTQIKEHADANAKLQVHLREKEQKIHELGRKMEEKERELHAIRLDNEAAWAKDDLLREQSQELQSYRRERDNSEAERLQHIKQIHDLQEHIQEKDRLFLELQDQHRIAQETILFKDEQLREAQAWITRAQEMDALQSTTNHTLQVELRERTEHYNQLWLGCQTQFAEMERLHLLIQQFHLELADVKEKGGSNLDGSNTSWTNAKSPSELEKINDSQLEINDNTSKIADSNGVQSGNSESGSGLNITTQGDHRHVTFAPSSLLGMPTYIPTGQMAALHPFVMHQQGLPIPSQVLQSHLHVVSAMPPTQNWQDQQQPQPNDQNEPTHNQYPQEVEEKLSRTDSLYDHEPSVNDHIICGDFPDTKISQGLDTDSVSPLANGEGQVLDTVDITYNNSNSPQRLHMISSQFRDALSLNPIERGKGAKEKTVESGTDQETEHQNMMSEHSNPAINATTFEAVANAETLSEATIDAASSVDLADSTVAAGQKNNIVGKLEDSYLIDERALLASIARAIGSGGRIRISTTLPNRLAKMLAPLHWHDYKKKYGKLDDFVASHPELFSIEGEYIQLREGAQQLIAATAAVAEVAAAAPSFYSSFFPSVAVTPMAQSQRLKMARFPEPVGPKPNNGPSQILDAPNQNMNGRGSFHLGRGSNVKIISKAKDHLDMNAPGYSERKGARNREAGAASSLRR
ncbi:kinesin-1 heavy chain [Striga asiatica]|uniref:Kinesin-1 heavy chain n=1 Tax=Striga asiatica TaxID=4170 RepID=A0A5A7QY54_STRAF|nr:kinesin-1 heavy chain [Striga asiatica]